MILVLYVNLNNSAFPWYIYNFFSFYFAIRTIGIGSIVQTKLCEAPIVSDALSLEMSLFPNIVELEVLLFNSNICQMNILNIYQWNFDQFGELIEVDRWSEKGEETDIFLFELLSKNNRVNISSSFIIGCCRSYCENEEKSFLH